VQQLSLPSLYPLFRPRHHLTKVIVARIKGWQKNGLTLGTELETSEVINLASKVIDNVETRVSRAIQGGFLRDPHHKSEIEHMY